MPQSWERRNAITSWSSSLDGACTRISSPWIDAWAFLNFLSLIALTIALAFSCGIPWVSLISRRTLSPDAGDTVRRAGEEPRAGCRHAGPPLEELHRPAALDELRLQHVAQRFPLQIV